MSRISGKTVFVGLSGGVDSSVAALLFKKQGYVVIGAFIKSYNVDGCEEEDAEYARRVAEKLNIPFYAFDMREEYFSRVVAEMIDGYREGRTPNPDILCNREIKFGLFWERARALGADYIATGHYVRLGRTTIDKKQLTIDQTKKSVGQVSNVACHLFSARDAQKDQSYFLWKLNQEDLSHCLFPLGGLLKSEVRKIAKKAGLPTAEKKDSQGICFLGKVKLPDFLAQYIAPKKGKILDTEGNVVGEHDGAWFYTIGQRHLNVDVRPRRGGVGHPAGDRKPYYVASKDAETNTLVVAEGENNPALYKKEIMLADVNFVGEGSRSSVRKWDFPIPVLARVRYRQLLAEAELYKLETGNYKLELDSPVKFPAPGQSAVLYDKKGELIGGGVIC